MSGADGSFGRSFRGRTVSSAGAFLCALLFMPPASANFLLAAAEAPPGWNPAYNGSVLLFDLKGTGPLDSLPSIPGRPATVLNDPVSAAFSEFTELFVGNRHGNVGGIGSIARFRIDAAGNYVPNGVIVGNGLDAVHGLAFSSSGELFAANFRGDTVSRFTFDGSGAAIPNGTIAMDDGNYLLGLAFSPAGELFANDYSGIRRFVFDSAGNALPNGSFTVPAVNPGFIEFSPSGELFVASHDDNSILRFLFDELGEPVSNGTISVRGPFDFAFSPAGELFVSSHGFLPGDVRFGQISRFLFDAGGSAVPNGTFATDSLGGIALAEWAGRVPERLPEPGTLALLSLGLICLALNRRSLERRPDRIGATRRVRRSRSGSRPTRRGETSGATNNALLPFVM